MAWTEVMVMEISGIQAQEIVESMKQIIHQDINFMNTKAVVIASTDINRIGELHGGAIKVLKQSENIIVHYAGEYIFSKEGINLPIYSATDIIGVIGITGSEEEVMKYGEIIKKMTEILIKEAQFTSKKQYEREHIQYFFEELMHDNNHIEDIEQITKIAKLHGVNMTIPRRLIVGRDYLNGDGNNKQDSQMFDDISNYFKNQSEQNYIIQSGFNYYIIMDDRIEVSRELLLGLISQMNAQYACKLHFGISSVKSSVTSLNSAYLECEKLMQTMMLGNTKSLIYYDELKIELMMDAMSIEDKERFVSQIFGEHTNDVVDKWALLILEYVEANGALGKMSEQLFIHKNTLQYRLNKIKTMTGYDPRNLKDLMLLYVGTLVYKEIK